MKSFSRGLPFSILVCLIAFFAPMRPRAAFAQQETKPVKLGVTISKETTRLTEPVVNGRVDFMRALNTRLSKGVTPENNAAVSFLRAVGPREIDSSIRKAYLAELGIGSLPEQGDYLVPLQGQALNDEYDKAGGSPWSRDAYPLLAKWVDGNAGPLAMAIEGANRRKFFAPLVAADGSKRMLVAVLLPLMQETRGIARALWARALLRIHEGDLEGAQSDLLACHRLARHLSQHPTLIGLLVAYAIESIASSGDAALADASGLTAKQALAYRDALRELPPMIPMADALDSGERFMFVDSVCVIATEDVSIGELSGLRGTSSKLAGDAAKLLSSAFIDWNTILKDGNTFYDRLVAAARIPEYAERRAKSDALTAELAGKAAPGTDVASAVFLLLTPKRSLTNKMSNTFISLLCPAVSAALTAEDRTQMRTQLTDLALALAAYRADDGAYPETLQDLTPEYVARISDDFFTGDALIYKRSGTGYMLYSAGVNQEDDGGRSFDNRPRGDDIVVKGQGR